MSPLNAPLDRSEESSLIGEIREKATAYIEVQLTTMERFGSRPMLTPERYERLVQDVMKPMIALQKARTKRWRVVRRSTRRAPDCWGVQRLAGYTDGKPSWQLATYQRFWSKQAAQEFIDVESAKAPQDDPVERSGRDRSDSHDL